MAHDLTQYCVDIEMPTGSTRQEFFYAKDPDAVCHKMHCQKMLGKFDKVRRIEDLSRPKPQTAK